jgi:hypothetical protein
MNDLKVKPALHLWIQWYRVWLEGPQLNTEGLQSLLLVTNVYLKQPCRRPMCRWVDTSEMHLKKKQEGSMMTGFIWCRIQTSVRPLWNIMNFWVLTVNHSLWTAGLDSQWDTVIKLVTAFLNLRETYNAHMLSLYQGLFQTTTKLSCRPQIEQQYLPTHSVFFIVHNAYILSSGNGT